jgi:hypothetical protein
MKYSSLAFLAAAVACLVSSSSFAQPYRWDRSRWVLVNTLEFAGMDDQDGSAAGWAGRNVSMIGLRADRATVCARVVAVFGNGERADLTGPGSRFLPAGQFVQFDLPGWRRNIRALNLRCHATRRYRSEVEVYALK